ncbi:hypothetical protein A6U86_01405 [Rhizobium sp. AC27/96]|uniref:DUF930 domain-containing protein n=1 Tax=Rhizobium TaxID=379 RepID=UPI0008288E73|nr:MULTISPECIES: DUF930 domain-containing protein [Rhizobium]NTF41329.1 DUF930 domain-containing protein [Rhizobium rhizogenes]OCJ11751.1 hypothetical protein A6U86_01405 [Rhizobium sp. AC27/96]
MLKLVAILIPLASIATSAFAVDPAMKKQLEKLDPSERMEQACDVEAMKRIGTDKTGFKPDKVIAYTFGDPAMNTDSMNAPGAVFRSKGDWYHLSYNCVTGPQHVHVREMSYQIGDKVPRDSWQKHYLYN